MARLVISVTEAATDISNLLGTVSAGVALGLFEFAVRLGANGEDLADRAEFTPASFDDPDLRIPLRQYARLTAAAKSLTGDPSLSLRFGAEVPLTTLSALAFAAPAPASARETLELLNRFGRLAADVGPSDGVRFVLECRGDETWLHDRRPHPNRFPDLTESTFARMVSGARRRGINIPVHAVKVTHKRPVHHEQYAEAFCAPTHFSADSNAMLIDERMLSTPSSTPTSYADRVLRTRSVALVKSLGRECRYQGQVKAELACRSELGSVTPLLIAKRMGLSRRTLARRLFEEGVTFNKLLDEVRCDCAIRCLVEEGHTIGEAAHLLGFSDRSAFSRAFKRWTGQSPGQLINAMFSEGAGG